jgi:hypothetical protein
VLICFLAGTLQFSFHEAQKAKPGKAQVVRHNGVIYKLLVSSTQTTLRCINGCIESCVSIDFVLRYSRYPFHLEG